MGNRQGKKKERESEAEPIAGAVDGQGDSPEENSNQPGKHVLKRKASGDLPFEKYAFPFENVVFEGGGSRALAYCGAVRVLEEAGIWPQIRRFAGTNTGALTATLLCIGYTSRDLDNFLHKDFNKFFVDHKCGYCSLLPNLVREYGWNPGKKLYNWLGAKLKEVTGNADVTFKEVYKKYDKELCVVVTNVNQMATEYCHAKTTPDMPVRLAVRMSMATPGMYEAVKYKQDLHEDFFVDGGVMCNYPVHCFDGWYLSMKPEDSYLNRLHPLTALPRIYEKHKRFSTFNDKTLGCLLYSEYNPDILQSLMEQREGKHLPHNTPTTKLAKLRLSKIEKRWEAARKHDETVAAVERLIQVLKDNELCGRPSIGRWEMEKALNKKENFFTEEDFRLVFGEKMTIDDIFKQLHREHDDKISYADLIRSLEASDLNLQLSFRNERRREVRNLSDFAKCLQDSLFSHNKRAYIEPKDLERSVGINSYYMDTMDYKLEEDDKKLLIEQGIRATKAYLLYFITEKNAPLKTDLRKSYAREEIQKFVDEVPEIIDERDYMDTFTERYN